MRKLNRNRQQSVVLGTLSTQMQRLKRDEDLALGVTHGMDGVGGQIQDGLVDLGGIGEDGADVWRNVGAQFDAGLARNRASKPSTLSTPLRLPR